MANTGDAASSTARGPLTFSDIAKLAGVSVPTVSKVVNGRSEVGADTRAHVEKVLRDNGYRRPRRAVKPSAALEIVFHEFAGVYPAEIIRGVERIARESQLGLLVSESQDRQPFERGWIDDIVARAPIGVIAVFSDVTSGQLTQLTARGIPLVVLDPIGVPGDDLPSVGATNWFGGLTATRHLLDLGHRRIAVITGPPHALNSRARLDGYRSALETAGLPVDPDLIRGGAFEIANGATDTTELLAMANPPTAIFALNDGIAIGVYHAASLAGLRIPDDLSVVGFDNYTLDQWMVPPLTTVHQPLEEMGAAAARMLVDLALEPTPSETNRLELATKLVVRASTAAPARR